VILVLSVPGLIVLLLVWIAWRKSARLSRLRHGPRVEGKLVSMRTGWSSRGTPFRYARVRYAVDGHEHEVETYAAPGVLYQPVAGDVVPLRYDPKDPARAEIEGNPGTAREWIALAATLGIAYLAWVIAIALE